MKTKAIGENNRRESAGRRVCLGVFSALSVFLFFMILHYMAPFMLTNDNYYLRSIVSGEMLGKPEEHMYYMGIWSALPIKFLYQMFPKVSWYGMFLCVSIGAVLFGVLLELLLHCRNIWSCGWVSVLFFVVVYAFFSIHILEMQYTTITGIAGCGAVFLLVLYRPDQENMRRRFITYMPFLMFCAWSAGIREKAFIMLFPFMGMFFLSHFIDHRWKILPEVLLFLATFMVVAGCNILAYRSSEWKEFKDYTDASEKIYDFNGFPDYDEYREVYEELGITRSSYEAAAFHYNILLDGAINADSMKRLADISEAERKANSPGGWDKSMQMLRDFIDRQLFSYMDRPLNILVFFLYGFVILTALAERKFRCILDVSFLGIARMFDWIYLLSYGRDPARVTQIIYIAELLALVGFGIKYRLLVIRPVIGTDVGGHKAKVGVLIFTVGILFLCFRFGLPKTEAVQGEVKSWQASSGPYRELMKYFAEHPGNFYFFDMNLIYYMEEAMEVNYYPNNYVYMGSWMPHSPWYRQKFEEWEIGDPAEALLDDDRVFLVYHETERGSFDFLVNYYAEHYPESRVEKVETLITSDDTVFLILKAFRQKLPSTS